MHFPWTTKRTFIALGVVVALAFPWLSFDFGITEDEQLHNQHGKSILAYFLGESDLATRRPLDASGNVEFRYDQEMNDLSGALNIYGGVFDLLCAASYRFLSPFGEFENRHFVNSLFGVLLVVFTGLLAARVAGWRAGILALLLMGLSPRIVGHSMNNPVDAPFAALYVFSLYFLMRYLEELPHPAPATWIPLLIGIPLAADVRIAGLVLIFYLGAFVGIWCLGRLRSASGREGIVRAIGVTAAISVSSYLLVSALWPFAHGDPLTTPWMALQKLSRLTTFNAYDLFEGVWIDRWEIPSRFVPEWLLIGTPLFIPLGLLLTPLLAYGPGGRGESDRSIDWWKVGLLAFTFLFPVAFIILRRSNVYNDARHVLFAYPPLVAFCAVVFESTFRAPKRLLRLGFGVLLAGTMLQPLLFMIRNHPNEGVYFSPLIGGVDGAWARYETDFWGQSVRQGVEWIHENAVPRADGPVRVRLWYGDQMKARYYVEKKPGFEHVVEAEESPEWDYKIMLTVECKYFPVVLHRWPPYGTVYEVKADRTPLSAVVMNPRGPDLQKVIDGMRAWAEEARSHAVYYSLFEMLEDHGRHSEAIEAFRKSAELKPEPVGRTHDDYVLRGVEFFESGLYEESILANRLALEKDPRSALAYTNICASYLAMDRLRDAIASCETALELEPGLPLAETNLRKANDRSGGK